MEILLILLVIFVGMPVIGAIGFGCLAWYYRDKEYEETKLF